jgi:hypothetical protein
MSLVATPDTVIAHVDLLRAVDRLLDQADRLREKRDALNRTLATNVSSDDPKQPQQKGTSR